MSAEAAPKSWATGGGGPEYLAQYTTTVAGVDAEWGGLFGPQATCSAVLDAALAGLGLDRAAAKVLEVGCSAGNKLAVLSSLGLAEGNLFGVDLSPEAVEAAQRLLPAANIKCIPEDSPFDYSFDGVKFDLVFCTACLPHVPTAALPHFLGKPQALGAERFMFIEGITPQHSEHSFMGWTFQHDDWRHVASEHPALGEVLYERRLEYVSEEAKEMFQPATHELAVAFQVVKS